MGSFQFTGNKISTWKSAGIFNYSSDSNMNADIKSDGRMYVYLSGNHFQQNKVNIPNNDNVINIYCVYEIQPISSSRDTSFTIQNALFGAMLYFEQYKLLKMLLIIQKVIIKDMVYVLMKEVNLVIQ